MAVHRITSRASHILAQSSHATARQFGAHELAPEHILYALLVDHPRQCASAAVRLGTSYQAIMSVTRHRLGARVLTNAALDEDNLLPGAGRSKRVLEDALHFAGGRGTGFCGLGDLFLASLLDVAPELGGGRKYELSTGRIRTLWALAWEFREPPFAAAP